jgi:outer membrane immunogenic protein
MTKRLISLFAITAFILAASGSAFAADMAVKMPVKAPPPPPAPVYSWTGWYVGGNVGYSWGRASADVNYFAPAVFSTAGCNNAFTEGALCINGSDTVDMNGVIGGVQAGYNWQNGNYLLGVEADFQGSGQRGTRDFNASFNTGTATLIGGGTAPVQGTAAISITERMPWMGTVRGRIGYIANQWLVYATGGLAYGRIEVDSSASASAVLGPPPIGSPTCNAAAGLTPGTCPVWGFSDSGVTKIGWTVGGGAELALGGNWTARVEYLFVDLGSFDTTFTGLGGCFGVLVVNGAIGCSIEAAGTGTIHTTITDNIVRVGLNYQFH